MRNFFIGVLITVLVITFWKPITQTVNDFQSNQIHYSIQETQPAIDFEVRPLEAIKAPVQPLTFATPSDSRAKQHESLQTSVETDSNRRGRNE